MRYLSSSNSVKTAMIIVHFRALPTKHTRLEITVCSDLRTTPDPGVQRFGSRLFPRQTSRAQAHRIGGSEYK